MKLRIVALCLALFAGLTSAANAQVGWAQPGPGPIPIINGLTAGIPNVVGGFGNAYGYPGGQPQQQVYSQAGGVPQGYEALPPPRHRRHSGPPKVEVRIEQGGTRGAVKHIVRQPGLGRYRCMVATGEPVPETAGDGYCERN